jgi:hypothetical protein
VRKRALVDNPFKAAVKRLVDSPFDPERLSLERAGPRLVDMKQPSLADLTEGR